MKKVLFLIFLVTFSLCVNGQELHFEGEFESELPCIDGFSVGVIFLNLSDDDEEKLQLATIDIEPKQGETFTGTLDLKKYPEIAETQFSIGLLIVFVDQDGDGQLGINELDSERTWGGSNDYVITYIKDENPFADISDHLYEKGDPTLNELKQGLNIGKVSRETYPFDNIVPASKNTKVVLEIGLDFVFEFNFT